MKAWTLNKPAPVESHPLLLTEVPIPTPGEDEVLVRVHACAICRTDLHVVEGELPVRRSPVIPGHQIVGRVVALGSRVTEFAVTDRVGIAWLNRTCGVCDFCRSGRENLCDRPLFTGWSVDGGYLYYTTELSTNDGSRSASRTSFADAPQP